MARPRTANLFTVLLLPIIGAVVALFSITQIAKAHAELLETNPIQGATLQQVPKEIILTFDEPVQPAASIRLIGEGFAEVIELPTRVDSQRLIGTVDQLGKTGRWTVQWAVISADGDQISGNYQFELQASPPWSLWARWIVYSMIFVGLIGFVLRKKAG